MARFSDKIAAANIQKVDNHHRSAGDKALVRRNVLEQVKAPVFDAFAGSGEMFRRVWHEAPAYCGCDLRWFQDDPRLAFVADNRRVLRCIDLEPFGIFDRDSWGSPWEQAAIIAARRLVKPGERVAAFLEGAVVVHVHEDVATRLMLCQDAFAAVECQRTRASTAHGCRLQPALIQRCNQLREEAQLSCIDMIALCKLLDMLHPSGVRLDAAIRDAFCIADHVHQLKCRFSVADACSPHTKIHINQYIENVPRPMRRGCHR